jgi:antitoxin component YwqK of YwqJK toxin-antitoxin module
MKRLLKHQTLFILLFSVKLFSQNPIFIPASESALMFINPSLSGFDYKNRIAYNQLIESHPNGNIHSMNLGYYFDIPKLDLLTGFQYSADRVGTSNQNMSFRWNLGYELKLTHKVVLIPTIHVSHSQNSIDSKTYFNRFDFNDTLFNPLGNDSESNYWDFSSGFVLKSDKFYAGIYQRVNNANIGRYDGINVVSNNNFSFFTGCKFGSFNPYFSYSYIRSFAGNNDSLNLKFPTINNFNFLINYQSNKKWFSGVGFRAIKNLPTMYHGQLGLKFKSFSLTYSLGMSPYKALSNMNKFAFSNQVSLELFLKRSKSYHRPVHRIEEETYPDKSIKIERIYVDDQLCDYNEYFENGDQKIVKSFKNGTLIGRYLEYFENGESVEGQYKNGLKNGKWFYSDSKGNNYKYEIYKMGKLVEEKLLPKEN